MTLLNGEWMGDGGCCTHLLCRMCSMREYIHHHTIFFQEDEDEEQKNKELCCQNESCVS